MSREVLYGVNEFLIALVVIVLLLLAVEAGFRAAGKAAPEITDVAKSQVTTIFGAMFGLLASLLGFTFAMSLARFDQRKLLVMEESNAIETTYLRSSLLPEPDKTAIASLLR